MTARALLTWAEDIADGVAAVRHAACGKTYDVELIGHPVDAPIDGAGKLCCPACEKRRSGSGYGFVELRSRRTAAERAGGQPWGPLPWAFARGETLMLDPLEFRLVVALWGFQGEHDAARPGIATLAGLCGRSERHVGRVLDGLVERGLIIRWRPSKREAYRYDVGPLVRGEVSAPIEPRHRTSTSTHTGHPRPDSHWTPTSGEEEPGARRTTEEETPDGVSCADTTTLPPIDDEPGPVLNGGVAPATRLEGYDPLADHRLSGDAARMAEAIRHRRERRAAA